MAKKYNKKLKKNYINLLKILIVCISKYYELFPHFLTFHVQAINLNNRFELVCKTRTPPTK